MESATEQLLDAAEAGNIDKIKEALDNGADMEATTEWVRLE